MNITDLKLNDYAIICLSRINLRIGNFTASFIIVLLHHFSKREITEVFYQKNRILNIYHRKTLRN